MPWYATVWSSSSLLLKRLLLQVLNGLFLIATVVTNIYSVFKAEKAGNRVKRSLIDNPTKVEYALGLLSSLEELHDENFICDFIIKVEDVSFPVHRAILAASSKYFKAMLGSGMVEVKQGYINMKGVEADVMKICIKYIYTGDAKIVPELVGCILEAAHLVQLDGLVKKCLNFLLENISAQNCVSTIALSQLYDQRGIENLAEKYLVEHLREVSSTESFSTISKDDFVRYVKGAEEDHKVLWKVVIAWVSPKEENRDQLLVELMEVVKIQNFSFQFLFDKISNEVLVKNSAAVLDNLLEAMFSHGGVKQNLTADNVFQLRKLIQQSNLANKDKALKIIKQFMLENFEALIEKDEFVHLDEDDILMFLQSSETKCSSEEFKWKAILKWTKHERRRKNSFAKLFKFLQRQRISTKFIRDKIRVESMVKESTECMDLIVQALCAKTEEATAITEEKERPNSCIAFLDWRDVGMMRLFDIENSRFSVLSTFKDTAMPYTGISATDCNVVSCNGDIYVLIKGNFFKLNRNNKWIRLRQMPGTPDFWLKMVSFQGDIFVLADDPIMTCHHPTRNEWTMDLPGCGLDSGFCVVSSESNLFALGGRNGKATNEVKKFHPSNKSWTSMTPMLEKREGASAAMLHGMIVVAGGYDGTQNLSSVECYNHLARSWSKLGNMKSGHCYFSLLNINDKLYACGGDAETNSLIFKKKGSTEVYDEENAEWRILIEDDLIPSFTFACEYLN